MSTSSTSTVSAASPEVATTPDALLVPLRPCEPWCEAAGTDRDGHPDDMPGGDRYCRLGDTAETTVPLSLGSPYQGGDKAWRLDYCEVGLLREEGEDRTRVHLLHPGDYVRSVDHSFDLTVDEARRLAAALLKLAETADAD